METQNIDKPEIPQQWIYTMIILGFIGFIAIISMMVFSALKTFRSTKICKSKHLTKLTTLLFTLWTCNTIACAMWALCRTDLFINLNPSKCTIIYITNYLFYMFAKYVLHITLIYRLYLAFQGSVYELNSKTFFSLLWLISINFIVFTGLWMKTCIENVTIGITVPDLELNVCTLFNNESNHELSTFHKIWPTLFGAQDCIIALITLVLFMYTMYKVTAQSNVQVDNNGGAIILHKFRFVIRRLVICSTFAISSTFIFYTFAVAFYGNLTFLLPLDALITSFCMLLVMHYGKNIYERVCCGCDQCLRKLLKHPQEDEQAEMVSSSGCSPQTEAENNTVQI